MKSWELRRLDRVALVDLQEYEASIQQIQMDKVRVEQEEKRKTLAAETQQHQQVSNNNLTPCPVSRQKTPSSWTSQAPD